MRAREREKDTDGEREREGGWVPDLAELSVDVCEHTLVVAGLLHGRPATAHVVLSDDDKQHWHVRHLPTEQLQLVQLLGGGRV